MQHITIICVGRLKEPWLREGCAEYSKRLGSAIRLQQVEIADEPAPLSLSAKEAEQLMQREGEKIQRALPKSSHTIALTLSGRTYSSQELAERLESLAVQGVSHLSFIIGGSLGLGANILSAVQEELCLSTLTYPHQLCRLILLEQLYRAHSIQQGTAYHK